MNITTTLDPISLKDAPKDRTENFATYTKPLLPLSPRLMPAILKFLRH